MLACARKDAEEGRTCANGEEEEAEAVEEIVHGCEVDCVLYRGYIVLDGSRDGFCRNAQCAQSPGVAQCGCAGI